MTIKARFDRFTTRIRPTDEHIEEANRQTEYMVAQLKRRVSADGRFTLEKVLQSGSNAKHTSLLHTAENVFDVDLAAYYSGEDATKDQLDKLLRFTQDQLRDIYPNKAAEDIKALKSAVRVKFTSGIKLHVDVAPIIRDDDLGLENGGWLPRADGWRLTSVTCHNNFVRSRTTRSKGVAGPVKFNRLVRLVKWWNNRQGDLAQPSIFCDLITAAAFEGGSVTGEWQTSLRQIFGFLRRHQLLEPVVFADYYNPAMVALPDDPVIVLDSVNADNNIARTWTGATREAYLDRAQDAYDAMMEARSCELDGDEEGAVDAWCYVFGDAFRTLSDPNDEE